MGSGGGVGCGNSGDAGSVGRSCFWLKQRTFIGGGGGAGWFWTGAMVWLEGGFVMLECFLDHFSLKLVAGNMSVAEGVCLRNGDTVRIFGFFSTFLIFWS